MELKEFITKTITDVAQAVSDAKPVCSELGVIINPASKFNKTGKAPYATSIDFEIALTEENSTSKNKELGVMFSLIRGDLGKGSEEKMNALTRISFSVPIFL